MIDGDPAWHRLSICVFSFVRELYFFSVPSALLVGSHSCFAGR